MLNSDPSEDAISATAGRPIPRLRLAFDKAYWNLVLLVFLIEFCGLAMHVATAAPAAPLRRKIRYFLHRCPQ